MKYLIIIFVLSGFLATSAAAQQKHRLAGHWRGGIYRGTALLGSFKTHFKYQDGSYTGTFTIQGMSFPFKKIHTAKDDSVFLYIVKGMNGKTHFKGVFKSDSLITGKMIQRVKALQRSVSLPFKLRRYNPAKTRKAPKPYHHKDLIIQKNDSIKIGGTLTWPKKSSAHQLVIMTTGSGAENRDEEAFGFKIFGTIADYLTRYGIATFRYDDRGIGQSTGRLTQATLGMLASDVQTIAAHFSDSSGHYFKTMTLLGHSGGGEIAGMAAAGDSLVDKLILMSSPGISLKKVLHYQVLQSTIPAVPDSIAYAEVRGREKLMKAIRNSKNIEEAKKAYQKKFKALQLAVGADSLQASKAAKQQASALLRIFSTPKMQSQLFYDPTTDLKKLDIPVLVLFGGKDTQVTIEMNKKPIKQALEEAGVPYTIHIFPNANHLYQKAKTGKVSEYATLQDEFVDGFLETITQWLKRTGIEN